MVQEAKSIRKIIFPFLLLLFSISIIFLGFISAQDNFYSIFLPGTIAFISFYFIYSISKQEANFKLFLGLLFILKFALIFSFPNLSNDIYRFWWDGWLTSHGQNPYVLTPEEILSGANTNEYFVSLQNNFHLLNSPKYHSVYPLFSQILFWIGVKLAGTNLFYFNLILKVFVFAGDIGILILLYKIINILKLPTCRLLLFFGNPLCIIELNNNLHFEIYLILFLALGIYWFLVEKHMKSGFALGLSFISKLTSALYFPLVIKKPFWNTFNYKLSFGFFFFVILFITTILVGHHGFLKSIGLYFHQFEFNSLIYSILLEYFDTQKWYIGKQNIGRILILIYLILYLIIIIYNYLRGKDRFSFKSAWLILFCYLIFSSTVHPWYICPLILFSCVVFPMTSYSWSYLILFSYVRYDHNLSVFQSYLILIEYVAVFCILFYELRKTVKNLKLQNEF